jgi:hypothetical protein
MISLHNKSLDFINEEDILYLIQNKTLENQNLESF